MLTSTYPLSYRPGARDRRQRPSRTAALVLVLLLHGVAVMWLLRATLVATPPASVLVRPVYIHLAQVPPKPLPPKPVAAAPAPAPPAPSVVRRAVLPPVIRAETPDTAIHDGAVKADPCAAPNPEEPLPGHPGCPVQRLIGNGVLFNRDGTVATQPPPDDSEVNKAHNQRFDELDARFGPPKGPPDTVDPTTGPSLPLRATPGPPPMPALVNILKSTF